jgi:hypothetical protein
MSVHPTILQHHEAMHSKMSNHRNNYENLIKSKADYIDHRIINGIKEYNERTEAMIKDHNEKVNNIATSMNVPFRAMKNKYQLPIPEIGQNMKSKYCECKPGEEFCSCDHDEIAQDLAPKIGESVKATTVEKPQTLKLEANDIPNDYKDIISIS